MGSCASISAISMVGTMVVSGATLAREKRRRRIRLSTKMNKPNHDHEPTNPDIRNAWKVKNLIPLSGLSAISMLSEAYAISMLPCSNITSEILHRKLPTQDLRMTSV